ncbi:MAG TPA: hypothetical protein DCY72_04675, partial [Ruminococcaceae bacterium]|nr:hypothetical protein [Oscillospiraceae bacterium]
LPDIKFQGSPAVQKNELGGVEQQLKQDHSLLNTYRRLIKIRLQNPDIARGSIETVVDFDDPNCTGMVIKNGDSRVLVIHNGGKEAKELKIEAIEKPELRGWVIADTAEKPSEETPKLSGTTLSVPARTSVVLKEKK